MRLLSSTWRLLVAHQAAHKEKRLKLFSSSTSKSQDLYVMMFFQMGSVGWIADWSSQHFVWEHGPHSSDCNRVTHCNLHCEPIKQFNVENNAISTIVSAISRFKNSFISTIVHTVEHVTRKRVLWQMLIGLTIFQNFSATSSTLMLHGRQLLSMERFVFQCILKLHTRRFYATELHLSLKLRCYDKVRWN